VGGGGRGFATERLLLQAGDRVWEPDVTVTLAVLVPAVAYDFPTDAAAPDRPSVPLQEYAYVPVPPETLAVQVAEPPTVIAAGDTAQETVSGGVTVTVATAVPEPEEFVHVSV
jgi:hypothetical protein